MLLTVCGLHLMAVGLILGAGYAAQRYPSAPEIRADSGLVGVQFAVPDWLLRWAVGSLVAGGLCFYLAIRMSGAEGRAMPERWPSRVCVCATAMICAASSVLALVLASRERDARISSIALAAAIVITVLGSAWNITRPRPPSLTAPDRSD